METKIHEEFVSGDKVRCTGNEGDNSLIVDKVYTVCSVVPDGHYVYLDGKQGHFPARLFRKVHLPKERPRTFIEGEWALHLNKGWGKCYYRDGTLVYCGNDFCSDGSLVGSYAPVLLHEDQANLLGYYRPKQKVKKEWVGYAALDYTEGMPPLKLIGKKYEGPLPKMEVTVIYEVYE